MNRAAGLFRSPNVAWTVSLVVVSVAFGCAHIDQGSTGTVRILRTEQCSVVVSGVRKKPCGAGDCTCILGYACFSADLFGEVSGNALELLQVGRVSGIGIISFTATVFRSRLP
jgi:hypothetical protein